MFFFKLGHQVTVLLCLQRNDHCRNSGRSRIHFELLGFYYLCSKGRFLRTNCGAFQPANCPDRAKSKPRLSLGLIRWFSSWECWTVTCLLRSKMVRCYSVDQTVGFGEDGWKSSHFLKLKRRRRTLPWCIDGCGEMSTKQRPLRDLNSILSRWTVADVTPRGPPPFPLLLYDGADLSVKKAVGQGDDKTLRRQKPRKNFIPINMVHFRGKKGRRRKFDTQRFKRSHEKKGYTYISTATAFKVIDLWLEEVAISEFLAQTNVKCIKFQYKKMHLGLQWVQIKFALLKKLILELGRLRQIILR